MNRIAQLRKEKHLNQIGLAMKMNISQYMVSAYETGRHQPTMDMLIELSDFFGVSVDYLIGRSNVRMRADEFFATDFSAEEAELLALFRDMDCTERSKALGMMYAVKHYRDKGF